MDLKEKIRVIEGFPKEGISFKDITTLVADGEAFKESIDRIAEHLRDKNVDVILGPEARGFIFGVPVAYALGVGFVPVRKKGKLPAETVSVEYSLEYGVDVLETVSYTHLDVYKRQVMSRLNEIFGSNVFNDSVMKECLPKATYKALKKTIEEGKELELSVAEVVASAMKDWAIEKGATHFTPVSYTHLIIKKTCILP